MIAARQQKQIKIKQWGGLDYYISLLNECSYRFFPSLFIQFSDVHNKIKISWWNLARFNLCHRTKLIKLKQE